MCHRCVIIRSAADAGGVLGDIYRHAIVPRDDLGKRERRRAERAEFSKDGLAADVDPDEFETSDIRVVMKATPKGKLELVRQIRSSLDYASWKDRTALAVAIKPNYTASSTEAALAEVEAFEQGLWRINSQLWPLGGRPGTG